VASLAAFVPGLQVRARICARMCVRICVCRCGVGVGVLGGCVYASLPTLADNTSWFVQERVILKEAPKAVRESCPRAGRPETGHRAHLCAIIVIATHTRLLLARRHACHS
jgi:hypothetical protein